jgi:hypothetical protein
MNRVLLKRALDQLKYWVPTQAKLLEDAPCHVIFTESMIYESKKDIADAEAVIDAINVALAQPEQESRPVAEVIECPLMGQQTLREYGEGWKFLRYGDLLYAAQPLTNTGQIRDVILSTTKIMIDDIMDGLDEPDSILSNSTELDQLRLELADMTTQRDKIRRSYIATSMIAFPEKTVEEIINAINAKMIEKS